MSAKSRMKLYSQDASKLPRLFNNNAKSKIPMPTVLPTREEFQNQISLGIYQNNQQQQITSNLRNDLVPYSLETFCESTKEFLKDENMLRKSKLVQTDFGKYVFVNEHGILLNKYGPVSYWIESLLLKHY